MSLGWSAPAGSSAPRCSTISGVPGVLPRLVCAVSPQDDWIRDACSCMRTWVGQAGNPEPCITTSGSAGTLHCCPPGCPSTAADGGAATVTAAVHAAADEAKRAAAGGNGDNNDDNGNGNDNGDSSTWPYVVGGLGLGAVLIGGLAYWYYRKTTKRAELEESLLHLMSQEEVA